MKKFFLGCATAAMVLTPAISEAGSRSNNWVGPMVIGTVLGVIIGSSNNSNHSEPAVHHQARHRPQHRRHHRPQHVRYVEQCLRQPHRYINNYGHYHDYTTVECRMIPDTGHHYR